MESAEAERRSSKGMLREEVGPGGAESLGETGVVVGFAAMRWFKPKPAIRRLMARMRVLNRGLPRTPGRCPGFGVNARRLREGKC
jgi:hypothetical protein